MRLLAAAILCTAPALWLLCPAGASGQAAGVKKEGKAASQAKQDAKAEAEAKTKAKKHFKQGQVLYKEQNYSAAMIEFKASYDAYPNWKMRYYVGVTLQALHRFVEARTELQLYLSEGGSDVPEDKSAEVKQILDSLEGVIGMLSIEVDAGDASIYCDGSFTGKTPLTQPVLLLDVGRHKLEVKKEGYEDFSKDIDIPGGEKVELSVQLIKVKPVLVTKAAGEGDASAAAAKKKKKIRPEIFYGIVGLTGALLVGTAVTGGLAMKNHQDFESTPEDDLQARSDLKDKGNKLNVGADVLFGLTAASAAAMIVLAFFTDFPKKEKRPTSFILSPERGGLQLSIIRTF